MKTCTSCFSRTESSNLDFYLGTPVLAATSEHPPQLTLLCDTLVGLPWLLYSGTPQQQNFASDDLGGARVESFDGEAFLEPNCRIPYCGIVLHTLDNFLHGHV